MGNSAGILQGRNDNGVTALKVAQEKSKRNRLFRDETERTIMISSLRTVCEDNTDKHITGVLIIRTQSLDSETSMVPCVDGEMLSPQKNFGCQMWQD